MFLEKPVSSFVHDLFSKSKMKRFEFQDYNFSYVLLIQLVIMLKADGLQTAGGHCIPDLDVSNGYLICGHVD